MNQTTRIIAGVAALIIGAVAIGWIYFQLSPDAWDEFTAEMAGESTQSRPDTQPDIRRPASRAGDLIASGSIEAEEVTVAAELGGRIVETGAAEGDVPKLLHVITSAPSLSREASRDLAHPFACQAPDDSLEGNRERRVARRRLLVADRHVIEIEVIHRCSTRSGTEREAREPACGERQHTTYGHPGSADRPAVMGPRIHGAGRTKQRLCVVH